MSLERNAMCARKSVVSSTRSVRREGVVRVVPKLSFRNVKVMNVHGLIIALVNNNGRDNTV